MFTCAASKFLNSLPSPTNPEAPSTSPTAVIVPAATPVSPLRATSFPSFWNIVNVPVIAPVNVTSLPAIAPKSRFSTIVIVWVLNPALYAAIERTLIVFSDSVLDVITCPAVIVVMLLAYYQIHDH